MGRALSSRERIYRAVRRIPRGRVATYGDVAAMAGLPGRARQVGHALHALPGGSGVPWHRVINAAGRISLPLAGGGMEQRLRLLAEAVRVDQGGRVKLTEFRMAVRRRG